MSIAHGRLSTIVVHVRLALALQAFGCLSCVDSCNFMRAYPLSSRKDGILQEENFLVLETAGGGRTAILRVIAGEGKRGSLSHDRIGSNTGRVS
jgi:hypothetical protein